MKSYLRCDEAKPGMSLVLDIRNELTLFESVDAVQSYADEIRRECAESFKETIAKCADILPNKVECVITGSDIERIEAAIMDKE